MDARDFVETSSPLTVLSDELQDSSRTSNRLANPAQLLITNFRPADVLVMPLPFQ